MLLLPLLNAYREDHPDERDVIERFVALLTEHPDCYSRHCWAGHITGSAWIVDPAGERVLLTHHRKLDRWLQPGGHSDGDPDTRAVAVREAEEESPVAVWMLLDGSASMAQADRATPDWSRFDAARLLCLCIAELAMTQGDRFGWMILQESALGVADPRAGRAQAGRMQVELSRLDAAGAFPDDTTLAPLWQRIGRHDLVLFVSDGFDEGGIALIERLAKAGREVLAIQVLTVEERDFPFDGGFRFRDQESGAELVSDGVALRETFLSRFGAAQTALSARLDKAGIRHATYVLDEPIDRPLHVLFGRGAEPK